MTSTSNPNYITPNKTIEETVEIIKSKISTKTPFALTRFGDGEIYILNRSGGGSFEEKNCKLWGYEYPQEVNQFYDDAGKIVKNAFVKSDIIGLMDPKTKIVSVAYSYNVWSIEKFKAELWGTDLKNMKVCDHMIARSRQLGSIESMKNILNGSAVNIVSPNVEELKQRKLENKLEVEVGFTNHSHSINFRNRDEFLKSFENIKEDVVLLGVGLQKDYGVILRDEFGKIVIDMGATMDAWSGIVSRPWFNKGNMQEYLLVQ